MKNYWGYRIDTNCIDYFRQELQEGRLRQGWGWNKKQDLRNMKMDEGAGRNLSIFNKVKKGDILLVPRCPTWDEVGIVEATEDFDKGYYFDLNKEIGDYGHVFPAKLLKSFVRDNKNVSGQIKATIKNRIRFWNLNHCENDIKKLLSLNTKELITDECIENGFGNSIRDSFQNNFNTKKFSEQIYKTLTEKYSNEEWEFALVEGLKKLLPEPIIVERTGGRNEINHGSDIIIRLPGLLGFEYIIAIQVKDYEGTVDDYPIEQISKADTYYNNENQKLIDKYVIIIKAKKEDNLNLLQNKQGVKIIFANELQELLQSIGHAYLGISVE